MRITAFEIHLQAELWVQQRQNSSAVFPACVGAEAPLPPSEQVKGSGPGAALCGACTSSLCLCGLSLGTPADQERARVVNLEL